MVAVVLVVPPGVCASATDVKHAIKAQKMEGTILIVQAPGSGREWIIWRNGALLATRSRRKNHVDVEENPRGKMSPVTRIIQG
jgi:hypothetical protein